MSGASVASDISCHFCGTSPSVDSTMKNPNTLRSFLISNAQSRCRIIWCRTRIHLVQVVVPASVRFFVVSLGFCVFRPAGRYAESALTSAQNRISATGPRKFVCNSQILCLTENPDLTALCSNNVTLIDRVSLMATRGQLFLFDDQFKKKPLNC